MSQDLMVHNSLKRQKEVFTPLQEGYVGMYVCGPTVYSDVHLGNCRTFVSFDVIYRYLLHLGYRVRYVRNITDVGHLTGDSDEGEDKMSKRAKLEQLEPMEVAQKYTVGFHDMMRIFNTLSPSIEPRATGHIPEQIEMVQAILDNGFAYESNGSVYFDTLKFAENKGIYGDLSGRKIDELLVESRDDLKNQEEKRHPADFAIWMKASPEHLMRWNSPWSVGFPGWHLECSAMSRKYLGEQFDIHGGGSDLKFPHHENEVAQNVGACDCTGARVWLHTNMLLMNGRKMSKSDGNTVTPDQLFTGDSPHLSKGYSPMAIRFFMLQSHYSSTLDLTDEALQAAEKGYKRLLEGYRLLQSISLGDNPNLINFREDSLSALEMKTLLRLAHEEMRDDFNTPKAIARLFELVKTLNTLNGVTVSLKEHFSNNTLKELKVGFKTFLFDILGLVDEASADTGNGDALESAMQLILDIRQDARTNQDWSTSDKIRDALKAAGIVVKDGKDGAEWSVE